MSAKQQHPFHLVELSPWPILTAFSLLFVTLGVVFLMHGHSMAEYFSIFGGGAGQSFFAPIIGGRML